MRASPVSVALTLLVIGCAWNAGRASPAKADAAAIPASISSPERPAADRDRDAWAKPEAVLTLLGARPGMHVIDYLAGDG